MVRYVSDDVGVMYLGQLVETCEAKEIYDHPLHPYTQGLLKCIPSIDEDRDVLDTIEGTVPPPYAMPKGCRFAPRCPYSKPICAEQTPAMREAAPGHFVACHLY